MPQTGPGIGTWVYATKASPESWQTMRTVIHSTITHPVSVGFCVGKRKHGFSQVIKRKNRLHSPVCA